MKECRKHLSLISAERFVTTFANQSKQSKQLFKSTSCPSQNYFESKELVVHSVKFSEKALFEMIKGLIDLFLFVFQMTMKSLLNLV